MPTFKLKQNIKNNLPKPIWDFFQSLKYAGKKYVGNKIPNHKIYQYYVQNKKGIEIGGPSKLFKTILPLYQVINTLDGVNFSNNTLWEGPIKLGQNFNYIGRKKGFQFIADATDLSLIKSNTYDFLLSSNCLEHIANPLKAIEEWKRVLRDSAAFILVLPNKESNFDHNRPVTTFQHLLDDYNSNITEYDLTHLEEILALHDLSMDPPAGDLEEFRTRSLDNFNNRTLHHHVYDIPLIEKMLDHSGFEVVNTCMMKKDFFALGIKRN